MTPEQAKTATLDALRDWLAEADGWQPPAQTNPLGPWSKVETRGGFEVMRFGPHPHPPTLYGAAAALPKGWDFWKGTAEWIAQGPPPVFVHTPDTGNEIDNRYRLAVLCRLAEKGVAQ